MKIMDEKGFVFLDLANRPYLCAKDGDRTWLFRWNDAKKAFVSMRPVTQMEIWSFPHNLTEEEQQVYRDAHSKSMGWTDSEATQ